MEKYLELKNHHGKFNIVLFMTHSDPIADLLTRIRNASVAGLDFVRCPFSNLKREVLKCMTKKKVISGFSENELESGFKEIRIKLIEGKKFIFLKRVSKPGCRVYKKSKDLKSILSGKGFCILSTPNGVITDDVAKKESIGGEILCEIA